MLRKQGKGKVEATAFIEGKSVPEKNELLFSGGINFNDLPNWQKRGIGLYWDKELKTGYNPKDKIEVMAERNVLKVNYDLPMRDEYSEFIQELLKSNG